MKPAPANPEEPAVAARPPTVLVIEDIEDNARLARRILVAGGFEVLEAADAQSGFGLALDRKPDIILVDLGLPDADGLTLVGWLRRVPDLACKPIVAMTAWPEDMVAGIVAAYGCDGLIVKPIRPTRFADQVAGFLAGQVRGAP